MLLNFTNFRLLLKMIKFRGINPKIQLHNSTLLNVEIVAMFLALLLSNQKDAFVLMLFDTVYHSVHICLVIQSIQATKNIEYSCSITFVAPVHCEHPYYVRYAIHHH